MEILIKQQPSLLLVQIVSLIPNLQSPTDSFLFRCVRCGNQLKRIVGKVSDINPGGEIYDTVYGIEMCKKCREQYTFKRGVKRQDITIILSAYPNMVSEFYCFNCYAPLLEYREGMVLVLPERKITEIPFDLDCYICKTKFKIKDMVIGQPSFISAII